PGTVPAGKVSAEIFDFSDFLPTMCELGGAPVPEGIDGKSLLPVLKGSGGTHRDWIYMWYSRQGNNKAARQFARNQRYKLYGDGTFFDIRNDVLEKKALDPAGLDGSQAQVREMLQKALDRYRDARPPHLGAEKPKKEKR
ncbi:MAG: hypothetical protein HKO57_01845, partial [Akkermansiaceae bacterium]|nr:hypothetical protein [Akkermansiaceae bacterium]